MSRNDLINGMFEAGGSIFIWLNVRRLLKDKKILGISLIPVSWFTIWGFWNIYYYHSLNQTFSLIAGSGVVLVNAVWVSLALYFKSKQKT